MTSTAAASTDAPAPGQLVTVRNRIWVASDVVRGTVAMGNPVAMTERPPHVVTLISIEDDAHDERPLRVVWELERGAIAHDQHVLPSPASGFDEPGQLDGGRAPSLGGAERAGTAKEGPRELQLCDRPEQTVDSTGCIHRLLRGGTASRGPNACCPETPHGGPMTVIGDTDVDSPVHHGGEESTKAWAPGATSGPGGRRRGVLGGA